MATPPVFTDEHALLLQLYDQQLMATHRQLHMDLMGTPNLDHYPLAPDVAPVETLE